jgi:imidazolonepropionase-like amidohydrolase
MTFGDKCHAAEDRKHGLLTALPTVENLVRLFLRITGSIILLLLCVAACAYYFGVLRPLRNPHPALQLPHATLAIRNATIYTSPDTAPIAQGDILIVDGRIAAVGTGIAIPADAQMVACDHCVVMPGFWNTHVHFTQRKWEGSDGQPAARLNAQLADMLTSRGFTTVVDAGSDLRSTLSLRRRIETGELLGPAIYTAGGALYPPNGIPFYLKETLPPFILHLLAQPATPAEAAKIEERNIAQGADLLKLFTGSYIKRGVVLPMPLDNAKAAVQVAHAHGQMAYSHPSDLAGVNVAIQSGVDVLAHAPDTVDGIEPGLFQTMVDRHMAMIPTLKMFATTVTKKAAYLDPIYAEVRQFHADGGELLFGTDVGYMTDYTTLDEFTALAQCGLNATDILRMLTTAPASRFGVSNSKGTLAPGKLADLVLLDADPANDITAFARVRSTIRSGRIVYSRP